MLDPTEKGWLAKYLEQRLSIPFSDSILKMEDEEKQLYAHLHNSGILYGHPILLPVEVPLEMTNWPVKERMKLIYAEAFIAANLLHSENTESLKGSLLGHNIFNYYQVYQPQITKKSVFSFSSKIEPMNRSELILDRRLKVKASWNANFWKGFFHNILLFVDLIHYVDWHKGSIQTKESWQMMREEAHWDVLKLISIAVNADKEIENAEYALFEHFIESAEFDKKSKKKANELLINELVFEDLILNKNDSWLKRKYYLELFILTLWADRKISKPEEDLLLQFCNYLDFDEIELTSSLLSVQSFVMNNWDRIHYLQEKQNFLVLRNTLAERLTFVAKKYSSQIKTEIHESKELMGLINLSINRELSVSEKEQLRSQLFDILKTIPALVIFTLPFSFLTIPVLMKIIPKSAFPSSFDPNRLNNKKRGNRTIDS